MSLITFFDELRFIPKGKEGIACWLQRTPRVLAEQGCGYSLKVRCAQLPAAVEILRQKGIAYRKVYRLREGNPEEVSL